MEEINNQIEIIKHVKPIPVILPSVQKHHSNSFKKEIKWKKDDSTWDLQMTLNLSRFINSHWSTSELWMASYEERSRRLYRWLIWNGYVKWLSRKCFRENDMVVRAEKKSYVGGEVRWALTNSDLILVYHLWSNGPRRFFYYHLLTLSIFHTWNSSYIYIIF